MTVDLERAKAGDERAFASLVEPFRRELQLHCYRLLGSVQDAEDLVQETLLAAWRGLDDFEERASLGLPRRLPASVAAPIRFISAEPLLGRLAGLDLTGI
jgi:protein gp37